MNEVLEVLMTVLDETRARAVIDHRKFTVRKPLRPYAAQLLVKRFVEWGDPNEAADIMIERAWQGFNADWVRDRPRPNGQPQSTGNLYLDNLVTRRMQ